MFRFAIGVSAWFCLVKGRFMSVRAIRKMLPSLSVVDSYHIIVCGIVPTRATVLITTHN